MTYIWILCDVEFVLLCEIFKLNLCVYIEYSILRNCCKVKSVNWR